jgi:hypothetical protein
MLRSFAIAGATAVLISGCGTPAATHVPRIVGLNVRRAEQQLFARHLRWRVAPGSQIYSRPLPATQSTSVDEFPVTGQRPAAGAQTKLHAVITIITPCTSTHPCS